LKSQVLKKTSRLYLGLAAVVFVLLAHGETCFSEGNSSGGCYICHKPGLGPSPIENTFRKTETPPERGYEIVTDTIHSGDTLASILSDYMPRSRIYRLGRQCRAVYPVGKIKAGHGYRLFFRDGKLARIEYDIDGNEKLRMDVGAEDFRVAREKIRYDTERVILRNTISSKLFDAVREAGGSASVALSLADIFAWDIDFIRDIREGDSFRAVVPKRYRRGEFSGYGKIQAGRFVSRGREFDAFLYKTTTGREEYFTAGGEAVRKTFLKAPLDFSRISSGYSHHRMHPILHVVRPHHGIDYAAPRGTPIKSVADGVVMGKAYNNQAGNYVRIRHLNGYVTIYNHMKRFAPGIRAGKEVTQGETIGYVGSTGLATGPHLDYRVKDHGRHINPLKIDSEPAAPIPETEMARFRHRIAPLVAMLAE